MLLMCEKQSKFLEIVILKPIKHTWNLGLFMLLLLFRIFQNKESHG